MQKKPSRPLAAWLLIALLLLIGTGALISGPMLFLAPDGHLLQWSPEMLRGTPFPDFLLPGIILFVFVGLFPLFAAIGLIMRPGWRWPNALNPAKGYHWAWAASWAAGVIMLIWIAVETALLGYISFLQPVIAAWSAAVILLTLLPPVRTYYKIN